MTPTNDELVALRHRLDQVFSPETASVCSLHVPPSSGHCAAVSLIIRTMFGGELVSSNVKGYSHWFNRIDGYDIDLTGDQFGMPAVQMREAETLHSHSRIRTLSDVNTETWERTLLLSERLGRTR